MGRGAMKRHILPGLPVPSTGGQTVDGLNGSSEFYPWSAFSIYESAGVEVRRTDTDYQERATRSSTPSEALPDRRAHHRDAAILLPLESKNQLPA